MTKDSLGSFYIWIELLWYTMRPYLHLCSEVISSYLFAKTSPLIAIYIFFSELYLAKCWWSMLNMGPWPNSNEIQGAPPYTLKDLPRLAAKKLLTRILNFLFCFAYWHCMSNFHDLEFVRTKWKGWDLDDLKWWGIYWIYY